LDIELICLLSMLVVFLVANMVIKLPVSLSMIAGAIGAGITGVIVGVPVLRLRGDYLAIVTLAFGEIIRNVLNCVYISLEEGKLFGTDNSLNVLLEKLAEDAKARESSFISLYFGEDVSEEDAQQAAEVFQNFCPDAEVVVLSGGQPVYYYIISME